MRVERGAAVLEPLTFVFMKNVVVKRFDIL